MTSRGGGAAAASTGRPQRELSTGTPRRSRRRTAGRVHSRPMPRQTPHDDLRLARARRTAVQQGGVLSRPQLYALGITRAEIRGQVRARRWQLVGDQSVCLHNSEISDLGHQWAAVFQGGPRAHLDGASALVAGGLEHYTWTGTGSSVPRGARVRRSRLYDIRQTRRWSAADLAAAGIPRTRPDVAGVRAALWAASDRQAVYVLTIVVQQGLTTADLLGRRRCASSATDGDGSSTTRSSTCSTARGRWVSSTSCASCRRAGAAAADAAGAPPRQGQPLLPRPLLGGLPARGGGRRHPPLVGDERRRRRAPPELAGHRRRSSPAPAAAGSAARAGRLLRPDRGSATGRRRLAASTRDVIRTGHPLAPSV